jgi:hypothetical protein
MAHYARFGLSQRAWGKGVNGGVAALRESLCVRLAKPRVVAVLLPNRVLHFSEFDHAGGDQVGQVIDKGGCIAAADGSATPSMFKDSLLAFSFPAVERKKVTAAFDGGPITWDGGVMLLPAAERALGIAGRLAPWENAPYLRMTYAMIVHLPFQLP